MLFKPDLNETAKAAGESVPRRSARAPAHRFDYDHASDPRRPRLHRLDRSAAEAGRQRPRRRAADLPVPVLAATPRIQDVPVYLDGVGAVRALNNVIVRSQVDGKLIAVNFTEGQDVKKGDVLAEIDPVLYKAQLDQAVAKKAQDEAQLANTRLDLTRYQQLAASNAGSKQQADTQRAVVAQQEALVQGRSGRDRQRAGDARLYQDHRAVVGPRRPASGRSGQHHPCLGRHRTCHHHPAAADRGAVQPSAAADRAGQRRLRQGRADRRRVRQ